MYIRTSFGIRTGVGRTQARVYITRVKCAQTFSRPKRYKIWNVREHARRSDIFEKVIYGVIYTHAVERSRACNPPSRWPGANVISLLKIFAILHRCYHFVYTGICFENRWPVCHTSVVQYGTVEKFRKTSSLDDAALVECFHVSRLIYIYIFFYLNDLLDFIYINKQSWSLIVSISLNTPLKRITMHAESSFFELT